ncbi:MAG: hypothetical protein CVV06_16485 [Gammaproteobacteria bacterium HGW-Gammaproteobacteria-10]|nr:MAG: hypothetical protein CVV06_16485 [Gammaproteobacteria bacterium HGW-Gammaproteobacteria-10]
MHFSKNFNFNFMQCDQVYCKNNLKLKLKPIDHKDAFINPKNESAWLVRERLLTGQGAVNPAPKSSKYIMSNK